MRNSAWTILIASFCVLVKPVLIEFYFNILIFSDLVCLDVLYDPHRVVPCNHSFCGPCLRRVGSKSPMSSFCPLCRQAIRICRPDLGKSYIS